MAEKDTTARLRRAVKENNLFLVKRLVTRTEMRNTDPGTRRYTSLAWAAVLGHEETFEFLLSNGHDDYECSKDSENNTILMLLADQKPSTPNGDTTRAVLRMARLYYDRCPKVLDWSNLHGKTALHFAAQKGNEELVRMLCDLDADFDLADNKGNTPLHYASSWGHIPVVQLLIERGCSYTARNNQGFTASDYAYSFSTRDTLQDTARLQFENNKKSRRAGYAQANSRGSEWGSNTPTTVPPVPSIARDFRQETPRMRSGSGTSRTTNTSDSMELDSNGLAPTPYSQSSISASSSPSQPSGGSNNLHYHTMGHSSSGSGQFVPPAPANPASALSPFATRVRERDADAMEKYMMRNRSGSQGTSSTDNKSQNGSFSSVGPSSNGADIASGSHLPLSGSTTPRRLRPSISASQLRSTPDSHSPAIHSHSPIQIDPTRNRSGTNPTSPRPPVYPQLTRSSSISNTASRPSFNADYPLSEESESYTGPPSQYAQFPDPPAVGEESSTPTTTAGRRKAYHPSNVKTLPGIDVFAASVNHRRGMSSASVRVP